MDQQGWAQQYLGQGQSLGKSQMMGLQNALGPKTHEERVEHNLREIDVELREIKFLLQSQEKSRRSEFYAILLHVAVSAMVLFTLLKQ